MSKNVMLKDASGNQLLPQTSIAMVSGLQAALDAKATTASVTTAVTAAVPATGTTGYVLTKTAAGSAWAAVSGGSGGVSLPTYSVSNSGQVLSVNASGALAWITPAAASVPANNVVYETIA